MNLLRNIKTYYYYSTFAELLILGPIIVLFYLAKGLNFTEIMVLQSIASISVIIFEVPTGAIADKIGRKLSLMLGSFLWGISLVIYITGHHFYSFALAEITFSLGATFKSGADTALIYDSLKLLRIEQNFQQIEGKARSLSLYAQAIGSVVAGFVFDINIYLPMLISIGFMIITILITFSFKEPPIQQKQKISFHKYIGQIKESGRFIFRHEKMKALIFYSMIFFIFYRTGFWYFQPYMEGVQIPVKYFGILFFLFNITAALVSKQSYKIMERTKPRTLSFMSGLLLLSFVIMGFTKVWFGVFAILLQQAARGLYRPVMYKYLNKHIPSEKRATILSFQSLANNLAVAVAFPLMGKLKDSYNIFHTHLILFILMVIMTYFSFMYMNKRLGVKKGTEIVNEISE